MLKFLKFLADIKPDCVGYGSALVRTIKANTGLTRKEIQKIAVDAEQDGLVDTIRPSLSGAEGLLAVMRARYVLVIVRNVSSSVISSESY